MKLRAFLTFAIPAAIGVAVGAMGGAWYGIGQGRTEGRALQKAEQDAKTVEQLVSVLDTHQDLVKRSQEASRSMRQALYRFNLQGQSTTKEIRDALAQTAADRERCVFPQRVHDGLSASRARAERAAAIGIRRAVPDSAAGTEEPAR